MAGTAIGGRKAAAKNLANDPYFYHKIGQKGGRLGTGGGFATYKACRCGYLPYEHGITQCAGSRGGSISRRGKHKKPKSSFSSIVNLEEDVNYPMRTCL